MIRITILIVAAVLLCGVFPATAAEVDLHGLAFGHWTMDLSDSADNANAFTLSRAYIIAKAKLSDHTSGVITTDINTDKKLTVGESHILLKYAYINWAPPHFKGKVKIRFGLQPANYLKAVYGFWGRRYVSRSVGQLNYQTSSDMGVTLFHGIGEDWKSGFVAISVTNGARYQEPTEMNRQKDITIFAKVMPFQNNPQLAKSGFFGQYYKGVQNRETGSNVTLYDPIGDSTGIFDVDAEHWKHDIISFAGFLIYDDKFDIGFDVNLAKMGMGYFADEVETSGITFFGALYLGGIAPSTPAVRSLNVFSRYDIYDPNTDADPATANSFAGGKENTLWVGLECAPTKGYKSSFVFKQLSYEVDGMDSMSEISFNTMLAF